MQARFGARLDDVNKGVEKDGAFYLLTLRLVPLVPFFLINLLACYFMYILSYKVSLLPRTGWLAWLGKHSLYIYILHVFVASAVRTVILKTMPELNVWVIAGICWTIALVTPVLLYNWLRPFGFGKLFSLKQNN